MIPLTRRTFILSSFAAAALVTMPSRAATETLEMYKTPWCGCCTVWADHMQEAGFTVNVTAIEDIEPLKVKAGVPADLASCHTAFIGGYVVEGHVPAKDIRRLLAEKPQATGLAVPGMPMGSPGMETDGPIDSFEVVLFSPASRTVFSRY
jgi:hypothetical protein